MGEDRAPVATPAAPAATRAPPTPRAQVAALAPHLAPLSRARAVVNPIFLGIVGGTIGAVVAPSFVPVDPVVATWSMILFVGGGFVATLSRGRTFQRANQEGLARLAAGDPVGAAAIFDENARRFRWYGTWHAASVFNLALCRMRQGRLDEARGLFSSTMQAFGAKSIAQVPAAARFHAATCAALQGDLHDADALVVEGEKLLGKERSRLELLAKSVVLCRRGHPDEARALLEQHWREGEAALLADVMRALRLVRAYATLRGSRTPDDERTAADLLAGARPFRAGDYDWLGVSWPEMRAFLEEHGLVARGLVDDGR